MTKSYDAIISHNETGFPLKVTNERYVFTDLKQCFNDGDKVTIQVKTRRKQRSLPQNALFHAYCGIIAEETGNTLEVVKSTLKGLYCKKPFKDKDDNDMVNDKTGEVLFYIQDTSDMDTLEKALLIDNTRMFALEWFNIDLPLPEQQIPFKFAQ